MLRTYAFILISLVVIGSLMGRMHLISGASAGRGTTPASEPSVAMADTGPHQQGELDRSIELTRDPNGYFYADVQINGAHVHMLVDTGATDIALSRNDAQMAGVPVSIAMNNVIGRGADGAIKGEPVTLDRVTLGDKTVDRLPAIVLGSGNQSLLGQSFLSKFASVTMQGDKMVLR